MKGDEKKMSGPRERDESVKYIISSSDALAHAHTIWIQWKKQQNTHKYTHELECVEWNIATHSTHTHWHWPTNCLMHNRMRPVVCDRWLVASVPVAANRNSICSATNETFPNRENVRASSDCPNPIPCTYCRRAWSFSILWISSIVSNRLCRTNYSPKCPSTIPLNCGEPIRTYPMIDYRRRNHFRVATTLSIRVNEPTRWYPNREFYSETERSALLSVNCAANGQLALIHYCRWRYSATTMPHRIYDRIMFSIYSSTTSIHPNWATQMSRLRSFRCHCHANWGNSIWAVRRMPIDSMIATDFCPTSIAPDVQVHRMHSPLCG